MEDLNVSFVEVHYVTIQKVGDVPVTKGDLQALPRQVQAWIAQMVRNEFPSVTLDISSLRSF